MYTFQAVHYSVPSGNPDGMAVNPAMQIQHFQQNNV